MTWLPGPRLDAKKYQVSRCPANPSVIISDGGCGASESGGPPWENGTKPGKVAYGSQRSEKDALMLQVHDARDE